MKSASVWAIPWGPHGPLHITTMPLNVNKIYLSFPSKHYVSTLLTLDLLQQLGITDIAQLMQLPRKALATRLGEEPIRRFRSTAREHKPEVIVAHRAAPAFEVEWLLEHPTCRRDAIETILERLSEQLSKQLAKHDHAVVQAEAILYGSQRSRKTHHQSVLSHRVIPQHLFELLKLQSETSTTC